MMISHVWHFAVVVAFLASSSAAKHPTTLSQVKPGKWAGALTYQAKSKPAKTSLITATTGHAGEKLNAVSLGSYTMQLNLSGIIVNALVDTGSSTPQVACPGVQSLPGFAIHTFTPALTTPAVGLLVAQTSPAACTMFCLGSDGCYKAPQVAGSCEYRVDYGDTSYVEARVYKGSLTIPGSKLPTDASFYFGCAFAASTNPYFFSRMSALFGFSWAPVSVWSQLMTAGLVNDTMYMCLGNGGSGQGDQSGAIILGSDAAVALPAHYPLKEVVTITLLDPASNPTSLFVPSTWVRLTGLAIGATPDKTYPGSPSLILASGATPLYYILDSGTTSLLLTANEYRAFNKAFITALNVDASVYYDEYYTYANGVNVLVLSQYYTPAQLNAILPPILFTFQGASGPVRILPGDYMVWYAGSTYLVYVGQSPIAQGILGNAWMSGWLIQQTRSTLALKMTRVKSCNDIIY